MKARVSDLTAIFFAIFGFTCWVLGDSCIKWIGQYGLPPEEIVAFMGFFMALTLTLQAAVRRSLGNLRPRSVVRQVLRALLDMTNNVCVVIALRHLSLTMFYILVFTSPMVISLLSALFLGERIPLAGVAHQNGTVRFGRDPATSALDVNCRSHEVDNLYVVDSSFFPSSAAVNPALTVIANALRVGDHLRARLG